MRIVLITTTIRVPRVLALYRALRQDVPIIVAGDRKAPHEEIRTFLKELGNAEYLSDTDQEALGHRCSPLIGWNCIQRRSIAALEAMRRQADVIVTIDDDNIPVAPSYFDDIETAFSSPFRGLEVDSTDHWFNVGDLLEPKVFHRGFPYDRRHSGRELRMAPVHDAPVGIVAGLWSGDPDVDAMTRIVNRPTIQHWSPLVESGLVVAKGCYSPFNTQNTAFRGDLGALMLTWVDVGRYDDIWAAYAAERVLADQPERLRFGRPLVWQERNEQDLFRNLEHEMHGIRNTPRLIEALDATEVGHGTPSQRLRRIFEHLSRRDVTSSRTIEAGLAWCEDVIAISSHL